MLQWLIEIDHTIFLRINGWHSPWADSFFYTISLRWVWIPVYLLLAWLLVKNYGIKQGILFIVAIAITVIASDVISSQVFKELFHRFRPCHNPHLSAKVHLYENDCGGLYGFVSSHAANFAAWCTLVFLWLRKKYRYIGWFCLASFVLVGYSRIYLGRHFPADVWGGMMIGLVLALTVYLITKKYFIAKTVV